MDLLPLSVFKLLQDRIREQPDQRLPSVRSISSTHHVSSREVVAALAELRRLDLVETRPGSGTWPKGKLPKPPSAARPRLDPSLLAEKLVAEVLAGRFSTRETLPPAKTLAMEWGCHPQTARAALRLVEAEGLLERSGRSWRKSRPRTVHQHKRASILLLGASDEQGRLRMDTDREIEFWREISNEAARNGLDTHRAVWTGSVVTVPRGALGIVVSTWHVSDARELILATRSCGLPVRTWQDGWSGPMQGISRDHPRLRIHDAALSADAGKAMGVHLLERGFRRIAWISPFHGATWSRSREAGLRSVLETEGARVEAFTIDAVSEWDFLTKAWADPELWGTLDAPALERLTRGRSHPVIARAAEQIGRKLILEAWSARLQEALDWQADAWVAANDLAAGIAHEWLQAPDRIPSRPRGLAGFDDATEALRQDLTSFRFDTAAMARSMIHGILSHRKDRHSVRDVVRHGGNVVPRGST